MTKQEWLQKARDNQDELVNLIAVYHPTNNGPALPITAPVVEANSVAIRKQIKNDMEYCLESAVVKFNKAIVAGNDGEIYNILQETWFGVPESTSCWNIRGFAECVSLLEDPWEED